MLIRVPATPREHWGSTVPVGPSQEDKWETPPCLSVRPKQLAFLDSLFTFIIKKYDFNILISSLGSIIMFSTSFSL